MPGVCLRKTSQANRDGLSPRIPIYGLNCCQRVFLPLVVNGLVSPHTLQSDDFPGEIRPIPSLPAVVPPNVLPKLAGRLDVLLSQSDLGSLCGYLAPSVLTKLEF